MVKLGKIRNFQFIQNEKNSMKKNVYILILCLISFIGYSQANYQLDSIYYYRWDEILNDWQLNRIDSLDYVNQTDFYSFKLDNPKGLRSFKYKYLERFDDFGNVINHTNFDCETKDTCMPSTQYNNTYNESNQKVKSKLLLANKITYELEDFRLWEISNLDHEGNVEQTIYSEINEDREFEVKGIIKKKHYYVNGLLDSLTKIVTQNGIDFIDHYKYIYSNDDLKIKEIEYNFKDEISKETIYTYDDRKNLIEELYNVRNTKSRKRLYYDEFNNLKYVIFDELNGMDWTGTVQIENFWSEK